MAELFEGKIRKVGTSFGVLIPKEIAKQEKLESGEMVSLAILKKDFSLIKKMFGLAKNAKSFFREHSDRVI